MVVVGHRSRTHGEVAATVSQGRFVLWLPGGELEDAPEGVRVDVTYRDGSTGSARLTSGPGAGPLAHYARRDSDAEQEART